MPDLILIKGVTIVSKVASVVDNIAFMTITYELIGPFGMKYIEVRVPKDGLLEPGGPSA